MIKCSWKLTDLSVHEVNYTTSCGNVYADTNIFLDVDEFDYCMFCSKEKEVAE